jgi:hypothetical protein
MIQHLRDYRPTVWHTRYTTYPARAKEFILDASHQPTIGGDTRGAPYG